MVLEVEWSISLYCSKMLRFKVEIWYFCFSSLLHAYYSSCFMSKKWTTTFLNTICITLIFGTEQSRGILYFTRIYINNYVRKWKCVLPPLLEIEVDWKMKNQNFIVVLLLVWHRLITWKKIRRSRLGSQDYWRCTF